MQLMRVWPLTSSPLLFLCCHFLQHHLQRRRRRNCKLGEVSMQQVAATADTKGAAALTRLCLLPPHPLRRPAAFCGRPVIHNSLVAGDAQRRRFYRASRLHHSDAMVNAQRHNQPAGTEESSLSPAKYRPVPKPISTEIRRIISLGATAHAQRRAALKSVKSCVGRAHCRLPGQSAGLPNPAALLAYPSAPLRHTRKMNAVASMLVAPTVAVRWMCFEQLLTARKKNNKD